jgi:hypothetical protein
MLLVTVTGNGAVRASGLPEVRVEPAPLWYATLDQRAAIDGDDKLAQARLADLDFAWDDAAAKYGEVLASQDSRTRATAMRELRHVREEMRAWWWQMGKYAPPVRWAGLYPSRAELVFAILFFVLLLRALSRRVTLLEIEELSSGAPTAWFGRELLLAQHEHIWRLNREAAAHQAGGFRGGFILAAPAAAFDPVMRALESLESTNAKGVASLVVAAWRYVGWSAKVSIGISGSSLSTFAVRHFASLEKGAWKESAVMTAVPPAQPDFGEVLPSVARRLAARLLGVRYARER